MKRLLWLCSVLAIGACAPTLSDYSANGMVSNQKRDYAACRIKARDQMAAFGGGLAALAAYNATLDDCMVAKGYLKR